MDKIFCHASAHVIIFLGKKMHTEKEKKMREKNGAELLLQEKSEEVKKLSGIKMH